MNGAIDLDGADFTARASPLSDGLSLVDALLRGDGVQLAGADGTEARRAIRALLFSIAVSAGAFGLALGAFRGGIQLVFAAVKLPLAVLLTAAIATPALAGARRAVGASGSFRRDLELVLASLCVGCLLLAALAPVLILAVLIHIDYHRFVLLAVACCLLAGSNGVARFWKGLACSGPRQRAFLGATLLVVFLAVGCQMSWTLRPFVVRPRTDSVPFVRSLEGSFLESVSHHAGWATGRYGAPGPRRP